MAALSIISVSEITEGTLVRVLLPSSSASKYARRPRHRGLFRVQKGGAIDPLQYRDWRKLVGMSRRKFVARVISNDTDAQELTLQIENQETTKNIQNHYRVVLPYTEIMRMARLVFQGREFDSVEDEEKYRRKFRQSAVNKSYFDPKDRFVGVSLLAVVEASMLVNFTFQVPSDLDRFTVTLPAGVFADGNYTVVHGYNTVPSGGGIPNLAAPDAQRSAASFEVLAEGTVKSGTTIDFHVKER